MATSTRPRRAAAPAPSDDPAGKPSPAPKAPAKGAPAALPPVEVPKRHGPSRQAVAVASPGSAPAAKKKAAASAGTSTAEAANAVALTAAAPRAATKKAAVPKTRGAKAPGSRAVTEQAAVQPVDLPATAPAEAAPAKKAPGRRRPPPPAVERGTTTEAPSQDAQATPAEPSDQPAVAAPAQRAAHATPLDTPSAPAHSAVVLIEGEHRQLRWIAGRDCPEALRAAATSCTNDAGLLQLDDDAALPMLLREAALAGHPLQVDPAAWQQLARRRDARQRLFALERAYPEGPASAALQRLLRAPLAPFQAEGALFAACAGRALLADERGLGKTVQALAAAALLYRHAGVERVLVHCSADQRLSWQREAARFLGDTGPEWRVVSDEPGGPHTDAIDAWKPGLVVIDEPSRLARWDRIDAPFALVLCGTPLDADAALAESLVAYLDRYREGPLARLRTRGNDQALDDALQALMLRRRRVDVKHQLPARVLSERVLPLGPLQRAVHDRAAAAARMVLAGWRRTRHLADAQQWDLGTAMQAMRDACHRAEPGQADSALAEHTLSALVALVSELLGHAGLRIAALAPRPADAALIAERLAQAGHDGQRCTVVAPGAALPAAAEVVIAIGMPWQALPAGGRPRQWIHLLAEHSIDTALYDTRELREGVASTPADGGHDGFLHGTALQRYLLAVEAALGALAPAAD
jgi:hypothetical protein